MNFSNAKEIVFYLTSFDKNCDVNINFSNTIKFNEPMECCLTELMIPNKLFKIADLKDLEIIGQFNWLNIVEGNNFTGIGVNKQIRYSFYKTVRFNLSSIDDLHDSVNEYIEQINDWAKQSILNLYPNALTPKESESGGDETYDNDILFKKISLSKSEERKYIIKIGQFKSGWNKVMEKRIKNNLSRKRRQLVDRRRVPAKKFPNPKKPKKSQSQPRINTDVQGSAQSQNTPAQIQTPSEQQILAESQTPAEPKNQAETKTPQ